MGNERRIIGAAGTDLHPLEPVAQDLHGLAPVVEDPHDTEGKVRLGVLEGCELRGVLDELLGREVGHHEVLAALRHVLGHFRGGEVAEGPALVAPLLPKAVILRSPHPRASPTFPTNHTAISRYGSGDKLAG